MRPIIDRNDNYSYEDWMNDMATRDQKGKAMNRKEIESLMRSAGFTKGQRDSIYNRERAERLIQAVRAATAEDFKEVTKYADELCIAVDRAAEDIGGSRPASEILADLGPATDKAMRAVEQYDHAG